MVHLQLDNWFRKGRCALQSPAAAGIISEIQDLPRWLRTSTSLRPFVLPEDLAEAQREETLHERIVLYLGLAEHLRVTILPQQPRGWRDELPMLPLVKQEVREMVINRQQQDELIALKRLAQLGSVSASIITYLKLTREIVVEALASLEDDRAAQTNLTDILGATRYRFYTGGRLVHVKCPQKYCYRTDTFLHMIMCYGLGAAVCKGAQAVPFLVRMARDTKIPIGTRRVPFSEELTDETRRRDAVPQEMVESKAQSEELIYSGDLLQESGEGQTTCSGERWHEELLVTDT